MKNPDIYDFRLTIDYFYCVYMRRSLGDARDGVCGY